MKKKVYAYLHTHWDREWYRNKEDFNLRFLEVFDIVIDELTKNNAPFFYLDGQVIALLDYLKLRNEKIEIIKKLIKEKKLAIGPYYVSADSYLINAISLLKNIEIGKNISKEFNQKDFIGYMSDIFGISKSVFEILKLANINSALIWRGVNPTKINNNCDFLINDINTTWLAQGYFNDFFHADLTTEQKTENIKNYLDKISKVSNEICLLPIGADHLGMLKNANKEIEKINKNLKDYEIILTSPFEYFKKTKHFKNQIKNQEFLDNSNTFTLNGVYSTRIYQKNQNHIIQNELSRIVEPLNYFLKENYKKNITETYKTLIKNHAHDGIYGCSLDSVASAVDNRFQKCENSINAIKLKLKDNFKKKNKIKDKSNNELGLFNLSNFDNIKNIKVRLPYILKNSQVLYFEECFSDDILADIYKIPVTEQICKQYTQLVEISKNNRFNFSKVKIKKPQKSTFITQNSLENDFIKFHIKEKSMFVIDKTSNHAYELKLTDIKDEGDSYNFAPSGKRKEIKPLKTNIVSNGEIQSCLMVCFKDVELKISINNYSKFLDFKAKIINKKENHKLQFVLKTNKPIEKTISQDAIGTIEREIDCNYDIKNFMPAKRPIELKTNSFPMQNFVIANDIAFLTKGLNEYEIYKDELRLCILRCVGTISNPKNKTRSIPAGPDLKCPKMQCKGENFANFAITFEKENKLFEILDEYLENYFVIDGDLSTIKDFELQNISKNEYFYGFFENKKVIYNLKNKEIYLKD